MQAVPSTHSLTSALAATPVLSALATNEVTLQTLVPSAAPALQLAASVQAVALVVLFAVAEVLAVAVDVFAETLAVAVAAGVVGVVGVVATGVTAVVHAAQLAVFGAVAELSGPEVPEANPAHQAPKSAYAGPVFTQPAFEATVTSAALPVKVVVHFSAEAV